MVEETGVTAPLEFLTKFTHHDPPENQIVTVFRCRSDTAVIIDSAESSGAIFCTKEEVDKIVESMNPSPWLKAAWKLVRDRV